MKTLRKPSLYTSRRRRLARFRLDRFQFANYSNINYYCALENVPERYDEKKNYNQIHLPIRTASILHDFSRFFAEWWG